MVCGRKLQKVNISLGTDLSHQEEAHPGYIQICSDAEVFTLCDSIGPASHLNLYNEDREKDRLNIAFSLLSGLPLQLHFLPFCYFRIPP